MKLLIVFVSVLVLVALGEAAPPNDEARVDKIDPVVVVGQEAGGEEPQREFFEEVPAVDVFGVEEEPRVEELNVERNVYAPEIAYIPMISRACTQSACVYVCNLLGFKNGVCVSTTTCQCY